LDEPTIFKFQKTTWAPKNYDNSYHGIVTLRQALAQSMNVATAKLSQEIGLGSVVSLAKKLGIGTVKEYPSIALGTFEASPWQLIEAYTVFANEGVKSELRTIKKVTDNEGKTVGASPAATKQVLHPEVAYIMTDMLKSVMTSGTAASSRRRGFTRPAAGKTGTTDDYRDAWFVGYTPNLICLVWTGYDDNTPLKMNGAEAALPIWIDFMKMATAKLPEIDFTPPSNVVAVAIDADTGKLASDICYNVRTEVFIKGTEPIEQCTEYDHSKLLENSYAYDATNEVDGNAAEGNITPPGTPQPVLENRVLTNRTPAISGQVPVQPVSPSPVVQPETPQEDQPVYFAPPPKEDSEQTPPQTQYVDPNDPNAEEPASDDSNEEPETQTESTEEPSL
jgi:membrane carboxypeptidase/penicillin-binding protein